MSLLQLSDELLDRIADLIIPEQFEVISLTCRRLFIMATKYKVIRDRYHIVEPGRWEHPTTLLLDIWRNPVAARWVRVAKFQLPSTHDIHLSFIFEPLEDEAWRDVKLAIDALVSQYSFLTDTAYGPTSMIASPLRRCGLGILNEIDEYARTEAIYAFLLLLFPNVGTLELNYPPLSTSLATSEWLILALNSLHPSTGINNPPHGHCKYSCPSLPRATLHTVRSIGGKFGTWRQRDLLFPLLDLPSVKKFSVQQLFPHGCTHIFPETGVQYNIEELEILASEPLNNDTHHRWDLVFCQTPRLRNFTLSHELRPNVNPINNSVSQRHWPVDLMIKASGRVSNPHLNG